MPDVAPLLDRVSVLSARSMYESTFPESPLCWKKSAFQSRVDVVVPRSSSGGGQEGSDESDKSDRRHRDTAAHVATSAPSGRTRQVLSFGDSSVEREAVRGVCRGDRHLRCKSVKFAERPSLMQLTRQVDLVHTCFRSVYQHTADLDLQLTATAET